MNNQEFYLESKLRQVFFKAKSKNCFSKKLREGEEIFTLENPQQKILFFLQGVVKLSRVAPTGTETFIGLLPEESLFGLSFLLNSLNKSELSHRVVAFTPVTLVSISVTQMQQELQKYPELWTVITRHLISRLLVAEMTIESQLQRELKARLVSFLLILCRDFGVKTDAGIKIDLKLSHQTLADLIHSHRPSVTRILIQLRQQQMISIEQQQITLHNPIALRQYFAIPDYS